MAMYLRNIQKTNLTKFVFIFQNHTESHLGCMAQRSFATMPFLATVIADKKVAATYHNKKFRCTIIYLKKSLSFKTFFIISHVLEFAKRFWRHQ